MKKYKDENWLIKKAQNPELTQKDIAKQSDTQQARISYWLKKYDIENTHKRVNPKKAKYREKEWLKEKCKDETFTVQDMADFCNVHRATVHRWLKKYGLKSKRDRTGKNNPNHSGGKKIKCDQCGKMFWGRPSYIDNYEHHFCERDCHSSWKEENNLGENHHNYERINTVCSFCGDDLKVIPALFENSEKHFCGNECYAQWQSKNRVGKKHHGYIHGNSLTYGKLFREQRKRVLERDNNQCRICGISCEKHKNKYQQSMNVHHIKPVSEFLDENDKIRDEAHVMKNLIALCVSCHRTVEHLSEEKQKKLF